MSCWNIRQEDIKKEVDKMESKNPNPTNPNSSIDKNPSKQISLDELCRRAKELEDKKCQ